jgi:hypothetical protein
MDIPNFLQENQAFQNLQEFRQQQEDSLKNIKDEFLQSAGELVFPIVETLPKIAEVATKLFSTGQSAIEKLQNVSENIGDTFNDATKMAQVELNGINGRLTNRLKDVFSNNIDPNDIMSENQENIAGFNKIQSLFKSSQPDVNPYEAGAVSETELSSPVSAMSTELSNIGSSISSSIEDTTTNIVGNVADAASNIASNVGKSIGEGVAGVAEDVAAGLGLSDILGPAAGLFSIGLGIYDLVKSSEVPTTIQNFVTSNPVLQPNL